MAHKHHAPLNSEPPRSSESSSEDEEMWKGAVWTWQEAAGYVRQGRGAGRCVLVIDGFAVDVTGYIGEHVRPLLDLPLFSQLNHDRHASLAARLSCVNTPFASAPIQRTRMIRPGRRQIGLSTEGTTSTRARRTSACARSGWRRSRGLTLSRIGLRRSDKLLNVALNVSRHALPKAA